MLKDFPAVLGTIYFLENPYYRDERGDPPLDAYDIFCITVDEEVCETTTGDGSTEAYEECYIETVQYCDYTVDKWETIQTYTLEGYDYDPVYEQPELTSYQRQGNESVDFKVYFDTEKGEKTHFLYDLVEFRRFQIGSTWTLELNTLGDIVSAER